jgi:hypothetical protein
LVLVACGGQGLQPGQLVVSGAVSASYSMRSPTLFSSGSGCYGGPYGPGSLIEVPEAAIEMQVFGVNQLDKSRTVYTDANTARWTYVRCYAQSVPGLSNVSAIWDVQPGQHGDFALAVGFSPVSQTGDCTTYRVTGSLHATCLPSTLYSSSNPARGTIKLDAEF